jgi:multiple sugar transport system substrate-binding protein
MQGKAKDLATAFVAGRLDRRELFRAMGKLGLGAAAMGYLVNQAQTEALAAAHDEAVVEDPDAGGRGREGHRPRPS